MLVQGNLGPARMEMRLYLCQEWSILRDSDSVLSVLYLSVGRFKVPHDSSGGNPKR